MKLAAYGSAEAPWRLSGDSPSLAGPYDLALSASRLKLLVKLAPRAG